MTETVTRYAGTCQSCMRLWKLRAGALVHHGYLRPGHGNIVGDCPGVGLRPYEETCDDIRGWMLCTIGRIERLTAHIEQIEAMQVSHKAYRTLPDPSAFRYVVGAWRLELPLDRRGMSEKHEEDLFTPKEIVPERVSAFARLNEMALRTAQRNLGEMLALVDDYQARITAWIAKPVITVEEMERLQRQQASPLQSVMGKQAATLARALAEGRKAKLYPDVLEQVLSAIGWRMSRGLTAVRLSTTTRDDLPLVERLAALGAPVTVTPRSDRDYDVTYGDQPGQLVVYAPTQNSDDLAEWERQAMAALAGLPNAPKAGRPSEPFPESGMYASKPAVLPADSFNRRARLVASNVWLVVPALTFTSFDGASLTVPEFYGVNYDTKALKPAGFHKWADKQGIRQAIGSLIS